MRLLVMSLEICLGKVVITKVAGKEFVSFSSVFVQKDVG